MFSAERATGPWHGIVVGFDGTERARCAVRWAAREAVARNCPVHVVRVVVHHAPALVAGWLPVLIGPDRYERDLIEGELRAEVDALRDDHPGLEVHAATHEGAPYAWLAEHADQVAANVLVVGCSDPGAVSRLLHGSTGADLVRRARQLVVVVRDETPVQQAAVATGYAPVVALLDDEDTSARVLACAYDMADRWRAGVTVVRPGPAAEHPVAAPAHSALDAARRRYPWVPVRVETVATDLADAVLDLSSDARMVVVGDRRQGLVHRLLAGSAGHRALHHAQCTVAAVP